MSPGAHLLASWLVANSFPLERWERRLVVLAGLAPDLDGLGYLVDHANALFGIASDYYFRYHHIIGHNMVASILLALVAAGLAGRRVLRVCALSLLVIHLHLLCDVTGSRGPDGYQWPIHYLYPFDAQYVWEWSGQWELSAWPNVLITLAMLVIGIGWSVKNRYSFIEVLSPRLDRELFKILVKYRWLSPERGSA